MSKIVVLNAQPDDIVIGGVQIRSIDVAKKLLSEGIDTKFLVARTGEEGIVTWVAKSKNIEVFNIKGSHRLRRVRGWDSFWSNIQWLIFFPISIYSACQSINRSGATLIHVNGLLNIVPAIAGKLLGKKVVWHLIGDHYPKSLVKAMKPILLLLGDRLVFVAHKMQKFYLGEQPTQNTKVIYEPVDLSRFQLSNNSKQKGLLEALNLSPENTIVGSIGNITPAKGWFYFIDAAEIILKSQPNARFVVVGSESTTQRDYAKKVMAYLEAKNLNDKFVLTGYRNDIPDLLSIFDIFMMASIEEGTPISILEAMAMKVPVIATNVGGIEEQVIHNKTGLLVESRNSQALAESCLKLIGDRVLKERLTVEARQYVEKNFSLQKCVKEHYLLYKGLIKN